MRQRPEIAEDRRRRGRVHVTLGQKDADQVLLRVDRGDRARSTGPTKGAWGGEIITTDRDADPETPSTRVAKKHPGAGLLRWREVIHRHQLDRRPRQDTAILVPALPEQNGLDRMVFVDCGDNPPPACLEWDLAAPAARARVVVDR